MGSRVNPYRVKEEWIDSGKASCHYQASAMTNQSVEEAFAQIAELAHQHLCETQVNVRPSYANGQQLNGRRRSNSSNFRLAENGESDSK